MITRVIRKINPAEHNHCEDIFLIIIRVFWCFKGLEPLLSMCFVTKTDMRLGMNGGIDMIILNKTVWFTSLSLHMKEIFLNLIVSN